MPGPRLADVIPFYAQFWEDLGRRSPVGRYHIRAPTSRVLSRVWKLARADDIQYVFLAFGCACPHVAQSLLGYGFWVPKTLEPTLKPIFKTI